MQNTLTTKQVQQKFNISRQTIYTWIKTKRLHVNHDWHPYYIWDKNAITNLKVLLKKHSKHTNNKASKYFYIKNRRFLGSKERLLPFIKKVVHVHTRNVHSVGDIFAGTGVVSNMFLNDNDSVIVNDILHSNYAIYLAYFGNQNYSKAKVNQYLKVFNEFNQFQYNYMVKQYGNRYFTKANASKLGQARQYLDDHKNNLNKREFYILLTSILYAADKAANTVGHYDAYRMKMTNVKPIYFKPLKLRTHNKAEIFMEDANRLVRAIHPDLIYIDTPYNSRQYADSYHVLENLTDWNKPKLYGKARKPKQIKNRRSKYNLVSAPEAFNDLITHIKSKYILVSFNNTAHKGVGRSNSKISNKDILSIMSKRGHVKVFSQPFRPFNSGKTHLKDHKELLYLVKVVKNAY